MKRTFLLWQEADISKVGGQSTAGNLTLSKRRLSLLEAFLL